MAKLKTKIVVFEGETELSNKELADCLTAAIETFAVDEFKLTQKPHVQAAQSPKASTKRKPQ
jgi:hypothetical protein